MKSIQIKHNYKSKIETLNIYTSYTLLVWFWYFKTCLFIYRYSDLNRFIQNQVTNIHAVYDNRPRQHWWSIIVMAFTYFFLIINLYNKNKLDQTKKSWSPCVTFGLRILKGNLIAISFIGTDKSLRKLNFLDNRNLKNR